MIYGEIPPAKHLTRMSTKRDKTFEPGFQCLDIWSGLRISAHLIRSFLICIVKHDVFRKCVIQNN